MKFRQKECKHCIRLKKENKPPCVHHRIGDSMEFRNISRRVLEIDK